MNSINIDTYGFAKLLQEKGFNREQTEGLIEAARKIDLGQIVTKGFLEMQLEKLELRITIRLGTMMFALGGLLIAIRFLG